MTLRVNFKSQLAVDQRFSAGEPPFIDYKWTPAQSAKNQIELSVNYWLSFEIIFATGFVPVHILNNHVFYFWQERLKQNVGVLLKVNKICNSCSSDETYDVRYMTYLARTLSASCT